MTHTKQKSATIIRFKKHVFFVLGFSSEFILEWSKYIRKFEGFRKNTKL